MKQLNDVTRESRNFGEKRSARSLFLLMVLMLIVTGCSKQHEAQLPPAAAPTAVVKGVAVETVKVREFPELLDVVGTVRARTSAIISTRVAGTVSVLRVREGDQVKKGMLLLQLDAQEQQAQAAVANAGIDEARRGVDEALARQRLADISYSRYQNLFNEQAISRQEFDIKQTEKELAGQAVARSKARLKQTQEGALSATTISGYTRIVAPISGIVTVKQVDLGASVFPAQPLLTIEDQGSYQLELAIPESSSSKVVVGSRVQIMIDALGRSLNAKVAEVVPTADPVSRTYIAKVNLDQKGVKSGMYGRAAIELGTSLKGLLVPKQALVERGSMTLVWVVDSHNIARMRIVKAGRFMADKVEILSGLSDGERLVVSGVDKVSDGAKVE